MDTGTIAGIAIGGVAIAVSLILWGIGLWRRREKIKIRVTSLSYRVDGVLRKIKVYLGIEFRRSGGSDIRYVSQILLRPDQEIYDQLRQYFELPPEGTIRINARIELPRDKFVSSYDRWEPPDYRALPNIQNAQERDKAIKIAEQLSQKSHKMGLVWEDTGKTTWKSVSSENFAKWV